MNESYQALTHVNLPFLNDGEGKRFAPGQMIPREDLEAAKQTDEDIERLIADGALGDEGDSIHPQNIIPDPTMPSIAQVVADSRRAVQLLEDTGQEVPAELHTLAKLDYEAIGSQDKGVSDERSTRR